MRIAYHPTGYNLSQSALRTWLESALADIAAPDSPGVAVTVPDPKRPYFFGTDILADDRETRGGERYSVVHAAVRRGSMAFNLWNATDNTALLAWHTATRGGRVAFALEVPDTREVIACTTQVVRASTLIGPQLFRPTDWEFAEWPL